MSIHENKPSIPTPCPDKKSATEHINEL